MPLTNPVIIKLNEITTFVQDKSKLTEEEVVEIKKIFKELDEDQDGRLTFEETKKFLVRLLDEETYTISSKLCIVVHILTWNLPESSF